MFFKYLIFIIFLSTASTSSGLEEAQAHSQGSPPENCVASLLKKLPCNEGVYQNSFYADSFLINFEEKSLQEVEKIKKSVEFQTILTELENSIAKDAIAVSNPHNENRAELYIFISFSMGEKGLLNLAYEAKQFRATLVLRGFHEGNYAKTAQALQKIITKTGQGVIIDPELYSLFDITAVPTYVLSKPFNVIAAERTQTPIHDKLQGHVSVHYALETFAKEGDLKTEARALLTERLFSKGVSK